MEPLILGAIAFIISLLLLYVGAKKTLQGAVCLANSLYINKVVAGTVVVAVFWESSHLALGNLIGSNIYNVPLIIGLCGLIREFKIKNSSVVTESAFMIGLSSLFALTIILTGQVTWWLGLIFLSAYPLFIYYSIRKSNNNHEGDGNGNPRKALVYVILGGVVLLSGTVLLVRSALLISEAFGLKEFYVGLTITAVGCIIPEAAVSLFAALQGNKKSPLKCYWRQHYNHNFGFRLNCHNSSFEGTFFLCCPSRNPHNCVLHGACYGSFAFYE